ADEHAFTARTGFGLVHSNPTERRIDEESVHRDAIADAPRVAVEQVTGHDLVVVVGGMGEGAATVAVADSPDVLCARTKFVVDVDVAVFVELDASALSAE